MSEDPIGFDGGLNLYGYVGNSPMMYTDPSGQLAFLPILIGAGMSVDVVRILVEILPESQSRTEGKQTLF